MANAKQSTIIAIGGGDGVSCEGDLSIFRYMLLLTGKIQPSICFLGQAMGDKESARLYFYEAMAKLPCKPTHLNLFDRKVVDIETFLCEQDIIFVGGGNTASMLAVWREHGVDKALDKAHQHGVILSGVSAGAICWFAAGTTDSYGEVLQPFTKGLGFLNGSCFPHYNVESQRRPAAQLLVVREILPGGMGIDEHAAVVYRDSLEAGDVAVPIAREVVAWRKGDTAYTIKRRANGSVIETPLKAQYIGPPLAP